MNRYAGVFVLICVAIFAGGCAGMFGPPVKVDLSTPKTAAMAYLKGVQAGDARTAEAACFGTSEQMGWVEGRTTLVDGMRQFDNALYAKFGNVTSQVHTDMHDSLLKLADVWVSAINDGQVFNDEDKARIDPAREGFFTHSVDSIFLEHRKEGWKVDIGQTYAGGLTPDSYAPLTAGYKQSKVMGNTFLDVARYIRAGTYHTPEEATKALYARLAAITTQ